MTPSQRAQWLLSRPACSDLNAAMQEFAQTEFTTSEQHKEVTQARQSKDPRDVQTLLNFLEVRNPFMEDEELRNIATGVTADAKVNVEHAKEIGQTVLNAMVNKPVQNYTFKKANQAITLATKTAVKINGDTVQVDPQLLFQRLITAVDGLFEDISEIFTYELCSIPSSIFDSSGFLREAQKPALADAIWTLTVPEKKVQNEFEEMNHIFDGGSLLQRLPWSQGASFSSLCNLYVKHVKKYSNPTVVFDGYTDSPSTKDHTHLRRTGGVSGPEVKFTEDMTLSSKKQQFLANTQNKQRFINLLGKKMEEDGIRTLHAPGDADLLIVQTAVSSALEKVTVLLGEDTDLLVLLLYHADLSSKGIYFKSEVKLSTDKKKRNWDIKAVKEKLGLEVCHFLPFIHALTGCDTTSRFYGIGKGIALKKLEADPHFKQQAEVFTGSSTKEEIVQAGEEAISCLYSGFPGENLNKLRCRRFCSKVIRSTSSVQVHVLPPTSAAAKSHSQRVYLQVQQWIRPDCDLVPEEWGWTAVKGQLQPYRTHLPAAPECLLKVIRCNCKTDCDNKRCSCRKHGLQCSPGCGNCREISCSNSPAAPSSDLDDDL